MYYPPAWRYKQIKHNITYERMHKEESNSEKSSDVRIMLDTVVLKKYILLVGV